MTDLRALQTNSVRKSDLENDLQFRAYLDSVISDLNSTIAVADSRDLEDDMTDNVIVQAEIDRDNVLLDLRKTMQEKLESDKSLTRTLEAKVKIDEELKSTLETHGKKQESYNSGMRALRHSSYHQAFSYTTVALTSTN